MDEQFPSIDDVEIKHHPKVEQPPMVICEKHGEINDAYAFRVNMPEFGYEQKTYCLVCAVEYLSMIANEVSIVPREEETK